MTSTLTRTVLVCAAVLALVAVGCSSTCEGECQHEYDKCMDRAPPGAARSDCQSEYSACTERCNATR